MDNIIAREGFIEPTYWGISISSIILSAGTKYTRYTQVEKKRFTPVSFQFSSILIFPLYVHPKKTANKELEEGGDDVK
jgi:hypothetical protein